MKIDKQKTMKEAQRIKDLLIKAKSPTLGLTDGDITLDQNSDGYVEIEILKGKLPDHEGNVGASAKNISAVLDDDFRGFRQKGWAFTQPVRGAFSIGVKDESVNETVTFAQFLLSEAANTEKDAQENLTDDEKDQVDEINKEAKKFGLTVKFSGKNNGTSKCWGLYNSKLKDFASKNYTVEELYKRVFDDGLDSYNQKTNEFED